jgi:signal transduction histidine kinase
MIGCHIDIVGDWPKERKTVLLFNAAIREALTNAVRHARANRLKVETEYRENCYFVRISCNGRSDVTAIHERGGLSDLRRRLEQEGAELSMKIEDGVGVVMYAAIPGGKNEG